MKLLDFIVCDDIRQEVGNKSTLVGVYADNLIIKGSEEITWPQSMKMGFFLRFKQEAEAITPDNFRIRFMLEGKEIDMFQGSLLDLTEPYSHVQLILVSNAFRIPGPGELSFKTSFLKGESVVQEIEPDYRLSVVVEGKQKPAKRLSRKR